MDKKIIYVAISATRQHMHSKKLDGNTHSHVSGHWPKTKYDIDGHRKEPYRNRIFNVDNYDFWQKIQKI